MIDMCRRWMSSHLNAIRLNFVSELMNGIPFWNISRLFLFWAHIGLGRSSTLCHSDILSVWCIQCQTWLFFYFLIILGRLLLDLIQNQKHMVNQNSQTGFEYQIKNSKQHKENALVCLYISL